jgi:hypothetical protein
VIFRIHRLLNVGLIKPVAIDDKVVLKLFYPNFFVFIKQLILMVGLKTQILLIN